MSIDPETLAAMKARAKAAAETMILPSQGPMAQSEVYNIRRASERDVPALIAEVERLSAAPATVTDAMTEAAMVEYHTSDLDGRALVREMLTAALAAAPVVGEQAAAEDPDWPDGQCPNCLTPWKCNGPHVPPASTAKAAVEPAWEPYLSLSPQMRGALSPARQIPPDGACAALNRQQRRTCIEPIGHDSNLHEPSAVSGINQGSAE